MAPKYCCVKGCFNNTDYNTGLSFFSFPQENERCKMWVENCGRQELYEITPEVLHKNYRVCGLHFQEEMFAGLSRNRLKKSAVPTIFEMELPTIFEMELPTPSVLEKDQDETVSSALVADISAPDTSHMCTSPDVGNSAIIESCVSPSSSHTCTMPEVPKTSLSDSVDIATQTPTSLSANTPRKHELRTKIKSLKQKLDLETEKATKKEDIDEETFIKFCKENFSESVSNFILANLEMYRKSPKGFRYSSEYKQFALTIYFLSPQTYKFVHKTFCLPSKATLCRITQKWDINPGLNEFVFEVIKSKVSILMETARNCVVCMDEMPLKRFFFYNRGRDQIVGFHETINSKSYEPARNVLVLMARGIISIWEQPIAYFFVNSCSGKELKQIIFESVRRLRSTGLIVHGLISDLGSKFVQFSKRMKVSHEKPYFRIDGKKVFYIFDVPHLIKATRNNFFKYQFQIGEDRTHKKYLDIFYEKDKNLRLCPKLTDDHLNPNGLKKMTVKLAVQVFSASVAAALNTYVSLGGLPLQAVLTSSFIEKMDKLFDLLNSHKITGSKEFNRPFIGANYQINFLEEMFSLFDELKVIDDNEIDVTNSMKFIEGWKISIKSFLSLWEVLKEKDIKAVYTRHLNQDCLENFFGQIRQQGGNCLNPTPIQCSRVFKKLFSLSYFEHSDGSNYIEDFDSLLSSLTPENIQAYKVVLPERTLFSKLAVDVTDYINLNFQQKNALSYISGYLIKKCLEKHICDTCIEYGTSNSMLNEGNIFTHFKAYENEHRDIFGNLMKPPQNFIEYISLMENKFCEIFPKLAIQRNVGIKIEEELKHVNLVHPCQSFPDDYLVSLYVRMRIFYSLKFLNRNMNLCKRGTKNYKLRNLQHL